MKIGTRPAELAVLPTGVSHLLWPLPARRECGPRGRRGYRPARSVHPHMGEWGRQRPLAPRRFVGREGPVMWIPTARKPSADTSRVGVAHHRANASRSAWSHVGPARSSAADRSDSGTLPAEVDPFPATATLTASRTSASAGPSASLGATRDEGWAHPPPGALRVASADTNWCRLRGCSMLGHVWEATLSPVARIGVMAASGDRQRAATELWNSWTDGKLSRSDLSQLILQIWPYLDPPAGDYGPLRDAQWVVLFRAAAPITSTGPRVPLYFPLRIYRGATERRARGMSWCTSRQMAAPFVERLLKLGEPDGRIWTTVIERSAVLAPPLYRPTDCVTDSSAREIVVEPACLAHQLESFWAPEPDVTA